MTNPGFEEGESGWHFPAAAFIDEEVRHGGQKSAALRRAFPGRSFIASEKISVDPHAGYTASIWVRREAVHKNIQDESGGVRVLVQWFNQSGEKITRSALVRNLLATSDWTQFEASFASPEGAAQARFVLSMYGAKGKAWFDEVEFFKDVTVSTSALGEPVFDAQAFGNDDDVQDPDEDSLAAPGADPTFRQGEIYSFPNPAKRGRKPALHVECGIADSVEIRVYNITGELVSEVRLDGIPHIIDGKYAYEHPLDLSGGGSGVYLYSVAARKAGEQDIRIRGKMAVIQ